MRTPTMLAAVAAATALPLLVTQSEAAGPGGPSSPVEIFVAPERVEVTAGRPCLPSPLTLGMTNTGDEAVFADSFVRADAPLTLSRGMFSTQLPTGAEVTVPATVSAPHGTEPGEYELTLELAQESPPQGPTVRVPVDVTAPAEGPGTNLLLGRAVSPSSTYFTASGSFWPCGGVDGDRTWSRETAWNSANRGDFPDVYTVTLPEPDRMNRIDLYTSTAPDRNGLRDWDVEVRTGDGWATVAQVRGNTDRHVSSLFEPVEASAVRIVGMASNGGDYSRIAEVEAYFDGPVAMSLAAEPPFVLYGGGATEALLTLTNITDEDAEGTASVQAPEGWSAEPAEHEYQLDPGAAESFSFTVVSAPDATSSTEYEVVATLSPDGRDAALRIPVRDGVLYTHDGAPWYVETGGWSASSLTGHDGTPSRYSHNAEGGSGATATWTPQLPQAGTYRVDVWYPTNHTTTTAASYTVQHSDGAAELVVNQQENADAWNTLGTWAFDEGDAGSVTLTSAATGHHRANAVRFAPVAE